MALPTLNLIKLGRISYSKAYSLQVHLQQSHLKSREASQCLLLLEHNPVYTFGLRDELSPDLVSRLEDGGAEVVKCDRGGLTTFHGPGQLVAYPIVNLTRFRNLSLRRFVSSLELTGIHTCRMLGVPAVPGQESVKHTGAWVNDSKICAIGVHCKRHVTTHGLALNCNTNLAWFERIVPCGIPDKGVTSLSAFLGKDIPVEQVTDQFIASFSAIFKCNLKETRVHQVCPSFE